MNLRMLSPLIGGRMQKVDEYQFYRLASSVHVFTEIKDDSVVKDVFFAAITAKQLLSNIYTDAFVPPLSVAKPACLQLWQLLNGIVPEKFPRVDAGEAPFDLERKLGVVTYHIREAAKEFETVLAAECLSLDTYFVSQKLAYNTRLLIDSAETLIPETLRGKLPSETVNDLRQAGRCVAFDTSTAAGFHIVRATETIIRLYYAFVVGTSPKPKMRNWGAYIKNLEAAGADKRITGFLDHIREEYRNPVLHPEQTLTSEEAQVLLNVCVSSIVQMMTAMQSAATASPALPFPKTGTGTTGTP